MNVPELFAALNSAITLGLAVAILFLAAAGASVLLEWLRVSR